MKLTPHKPLDPTFKLSRRNFLQRCAAGALLGAPMIVPRHVIAGSGQTPPSEKINIAGIGIGGMGHGDIMSVSGENLVAFCDVDETRATKTFQRFPDVKRFKDFRKMFDAMEKQIDAVTVSTPDHTHAVAVMAAIKRGKHVYCQKPLAHSIHEVRQLMAAARKHNVVTQLGNQGHSTESIRVFCEWIWAGAIGKVHTIHAGCNRVNSGINALPSLKEKHEVPRDLDWTSGWDRPKRGLTIRPTHRANGAAGCRSATARSATGSAMSWTRCSGRSTSARPRRFSPREGLRSEDARRHLPDGRTGDVRVPGERRPRSGHAALV